MPCSPSVVQYEVKGMFMFDVNNQHVWVCFFRPLLLSGLLKKKHISLYWRFTIQMYNEAYQAYNPGLSKDPNYRKDDRAELVKLDDNDSVSFTVLTNTFSLPNHQIWQLSGLKLQTMMLYRPLEHQFCT